MRNSAINPGRASARRPALLAALALAAFVLTAASEARAQLARITRVSLAAHADSCCPARCDAACGDRLAMLEEAGDGSFALVVRTVERQTARRRGQDLRVALHGADRPVDLVFSDAFGTGGLLVLDAGRRLHHFPLSFDPATGTPALDGRPAVHGPFGDPAASGEATALAEAPDPSDPNSSYLAVGTKSGEIIAILIGLARLPETESLRVSSAPVDDIEVVPQVGYLAFAAVAGGRLFGVHPDADPRLPGPQPAAMFSCLSPNRQTEIKDIGAGFFSEEPDPLAEPAPVRVVAADGTNEVRILEIPADPSLDGLLRVTEGINRLVVDIARVEAGAPLVMLSADGAGVHSQPGSSPDVGFSGPTLTLAGAGASLSPQTLNLRSRGRHVSVTIEVENDGAARIDAATLALTIDGVEGDVPPAPHPPQFHDSDGDGLADLTLKFDRESVAQLLRQTSTDAPAVRLTWLAADGTRRGCSARLHVKR